MQETGLSARRSPAATDTGEGFFDDVAADESKTRKQSTLAARAARQCARIGPAGQCAAVSLFFVIIVASLASRSRDIVCIGSDPLYRTTGLFSSPADGVGSDFGSLGVPWCRSKHGKTVEWTSKDLLKGLEEFVPIYETRPIKNNMYGMGFDHSFGLWFITRWLKPDLMIESGAFKGHSTWVLRQAMPDKPIISLSPRHPEKYLKKGPAYVDGNCTYYAGKDFVDFGSMDWASVMKRHGIQDLSRVVVFFDDHQNELKRLKQALKAGFHNLVFEDNYDTGTGDHYSLRQICDQFYIRGGGHSCFGDSDEARIRAKRKKFWEKAVNIEELCGKGGEAWWGVRGHTRDDFNHSNKAISYAEHFQNSRFMESVLDVYWELPPVAGPSLTHQTRYDPARVSEPIIEDGRYGLFQRLGLTRLEASVFNGYTEMVYVQISPPK
ncbi:hypothetical protein QJS04_geneDACA019401 [Acorus gramineus]|uniref:Uncharacterized protein n=1 Tax=Acorus gramineus TaxID=55184 RepID=A0AAV9AMQ9_ACOGR|nr:hypothetical protein QJS04_geneDACA019401 [Acorus gramineus]